MKKYKTIALSLLLGFSLAAWLSEPWPWNYQEGGMK